MRQPNLVPIIILKVNSPSIAQDKAIISKFLGYEYTSTAMIGSYKGEQNPSYIIELKDKTLNEVLVFAGNMNQESILYLDNERRASLVFTASLSVFPDASAHVPLGMFKAVHKDIALKSDNWTLNPNTNQYYITQ